jgi:hypothetical protein
LFLLINKKKSTYSYFCFSGLQTNWTICPLGSKAFQVTINTTGSINFYLIPNAAALLPLQFPLTSIADVSFD